MTFAELVGKLDSFAWGPVMLVLLVGTGIYLSIRVGFIQFTRIGYWMRNTFGKIFKKQDAGHGEVTPLQAVTTALAATVGTGNITGVTGAIVAGGPGAVFWMWISALFGMVTKYAEVVLAVKYRERNEEGDWVGGPMYYIKNGLGKGWGWLSVIFCVFGALAAFGIGNMTQINSISSYVKSTVAVFKGVEVQDLASVHVFGQDVAIVSIVVGVIVAVIVALVIIGGIKRIGQVTEKLVPAMAIIYIVAALVIIIINIRYIGSAFAMIFQNAFTPQAAVGGAVGIMIKTTIQKGVARGVFSNEAGLGSAPIAHAATSETDPVKQGVYGIFEVFMDTIVICTLTSLVVLLGFNAGALNSALTSDVEVVKEGVIWASTADSAVVVTAAFGGAKISTLIITVACSLFALSTILSWSVYGVRCCEYLFGMKSSTVYKVIFVIVVIIGATLKMTLVWDIADTLNGFMAIPNLIALLGLSGVVIKLTKDHFGNKENLK